jgi:hypothetical protein
MADHHNGYAVPIGGVVAYKDSINQSGVGFDIALLATKPSCSICLALHFERTSQNHGWRLANDQFWSRTPRR